MSNIDFQALGISPANFRQQYGPWALIAGASHGLGAEFAHQLAALGLNCVLLSRRPTVLDELKQELQTKYAIECLTIGVDLCDDKATDKIRLAIADREIGLLVYNAGAPPFTDHFLSSEIEALHGFVRMNTVTVYSLCHHFGRQMVDRGRGGIILVGSHAAFGGTKKLGLYTATKGFMLNLGESLWAEWKGAGVDVLNLVIASTDTPTMREHMQAHGIDVPEDLATPQEIIPLGLAELANGPTFVHPDDLNVQQGEQSHGDVRRAHVVQSTLESSKFIGD
ncbi:MAG: SDR family NAD(P)-dependent oxidoreductase [Arenicella sp.]|jgi:short-subunit dehydrogenase|nr:SDR family NAD(P)-dependent oxidoreductase [Arenicella sp.]